VFYQYDENNKFSKDIHRERQTLQFCFLTQDESKFDLPPVLFRPLSRRRREHHNSGSWSGGIFNRRSPPDQLPCQACRTHRIEHGLFWYRR
jgi:hypothetical protein